MQRLTKGKGVALPQWQKILLDADAAGFSLLELACLPKVWQAAVGSPARKKFRHGRPLRKNVTAGLNGFFFNGK